MSLPRVFPLILIPIREIGSNLNAQRSTLNAQRRTSNIERRTYARLATQAESGFLIQHLGSRIQDQLFSRIFRREQLDDFLKARITPERVPLGE